jgi:intergrase/recombinase
MSELIGDVNVSSRWIHKVNIKGLGDDVRREILRRVKEKLGFNKTVEILDIAKGSLHNYLNGIRRIPDDVISKALQYLDEKEFNEIVAGIDRLKAVGIIREDGSIDYSLILQAVALASKDEYLKQAILRFTVENFREDLRKMLGISLSQVVFTWSQGFEEFLRERKKRRKVLDPETIAYYRNLFKKHLEGKTLSEDLINYVINHKNKWLRNVFRHYIQYLYYLRRISPETYGWVMEIVPSRSYKIDVRSYPINFEDLVKTLSVLRENHELYYLVYRLMLEGGLRLSHAIYIIESFNPNEIIEINGLDVETHRLVCFEDKSFCRYYVGLRESVKPCEWAYFSLDTLRLLKEYSGISISRRALTKYVKRRSLLLPKYVRKISWRLMIKVMSREVARFIQSRFGELKISEARYEDLLGEADEYYLRYIKLLAQLEEEKSLNRLS